jgi:hypothetical protein
MEAADSSVAKQITKSKQPQELQISYYVDPTDEDGVFISKTDTLILLFYDLFIIIISITIVIVITILISLSS